MAVDRSVHEQTEFLRGAKMFFLNTREELSNLQRAPENSALRAWMNEQLKKNRSPAAINFSLEHYSLPEMLHDIYRYFDIVNRLTFPSDQLLQWQRCWKFRRAMWQEALKIDNAEVSLFDLARGMEVLVYVWNQSSTCERTELLEQFDEEFWKDVAACPNFVLESNLSSAYFQNESAFGIELNQLNIGQLFLLRVYLPCVMEYGLIPQAIFNGALDGDKEALGRLMNLDPYCRLHPELQGEFNFMQSDAARQKFLLEMESKPVKPNMLSRLDKTTAIFVAWLIEYSKFGEQFKPFTVPDVLHFLDSRNEDHGLEMVAEWSDRKSFRKQVTRYSKRVPILMWDILDVSNVPHRKAG